MKPPVEYDIVKRNARDSYWWEVVHSGELNGAHTFKTFDEACIYLQGLENNGKCKICGAIRNINYIDETKNRLIKNGLCFSCDHWVGLQETNSKDRSLDSRVYFRKI